PPLVGRLLGGGRFAVPEPGVDAPRHRGRDPRRGPRGLRHPGHLARPVTRRVDAADPAAPRAPAWRAPRRGVRPSGVGAPLPILLLFVLVLAALHGVWPAVLERLRPGAPAAAGWSHAFAPLALVLVLDPILRLSDLPAFLWPSILVLSGASLLTAW